MKRFITSIICLVLAVAFILADTATVEAKMTYVDLDESVVKAKNVSYKKGDYASETRHGFYFYLYDETMEKTDKYDSYYTTANAYSHNLKKLLSDEMLAKFEDGKVYLYQEVEDSEKSYYAEWGSGKKDKIVYKYILRSSKDGSGKISAGTVHQGDIYYLKDKSGNVVTTCHFTFKDLYSDYTTTFTDLEYSDYGSKIGFILKAGESFPVKYQVTGGVVYGSNALGASYDTHFVKVSKKGKITAKKNVYGITYVGGFRFLITDGSKKMRKALEKWNNNHYNIANTQGCTLTVNEDGSYTIKKDTCYYKYTISN
jgi:hypothetical protein